jgi:hypothetical protein
VFIVLIVSIGIVCEWWVYWQHRHDMQQLFDIMWFGSVHLIGLHTNEGCDVLHLWLIELWCWPVPVTIL